MTDPIAQAHEFIKQAETKKSKGGFFSSIMGGSSSSYEASADLYTKAANCFKIGQKFEDAGKTFVKIAELYKQNNVFHEAISNYNSAAISYLNVDITKAIQCYEAALAIQTEQGKFTQAAKTYGDVAEILEQRGEMEKASDYFEKASQFYSQENQKSSAYKYQQKYAHALAGACKYAKAAQVYEQCGNYSASQNLLKYSAKDHFFHACLCYLNCDLNEASNKNKSFLELCQGYQGSREAVLITAVIDAVNSEQLPEFQKALASYDSVTKLSPLCTSLLLNVKRNKFTEEDDVC